MLRGFNNTTWLTMNDGWADCWKRWDRTTMLGQCSTSSSSLIDSQPAERETQQVIPSTLSNWCWINALICRPFWSDSWERQMDSLENVPQEIHIYESKVMESCPVLDNYWIKPQKIKDYASVWTIEMKGKKWYHSETRTSLEETGDEITRGYIQSGERWLIATGNW